MKRSLAYWRDTEDGHLYDEGDQFPFDGRDIPEDRIRELSSSDNKAGFPLIESVDEQEPIQTEETPKKAEKRQKKAE